MGLELQKAFDPRIDTTSISSAIAALLSGLAAPDPAAQGGIDRYIA
jgi:hypothetical protein